MNSYEVRGRLELLGRERLTLRAYLEVYGGVFITPVGIVDASSGPRRVEYTVSLDVNRYYVPADVPLPKPQQPYTLVDYSIVYEHDPRLSLVQSDRDSTIVITDTAYTMVDGPAYPQLLVKNRDGAVRMPHELLWAYPLRPANRIYSRLVELEYRLLLGGSGCATLHAVNTVCAEDECLPEIEWRRGVARERLSASVRCWAKTFGADDSGEPQPVLVKVEGRDVHVRPQGGGGYGIVRLMIDCGGEVFAVEKLVRREWSWRLDEACRAVGYASLCPYCLQPF